MITLFLSLVSISAAAFIVKGYGHNNFLCCHACEQSYAILRVHDPKMYQCKKVSARGSALDARPCTGRAVPSL